MILKKSFLFFHMIENKSIDHSRYSGKAIPHLTIICGQGKEDLERVCEG